MHIGWLMTSRSLSIEPRLSLRFPSFARIHFPIISRRRPGDIWIVWCEDARARIVLNIHRASPRGVEASRVPGIHHPFKRAAEGRESRFAKCCQNVDEVTCGVEGTPIDGRVCLWKSCSVLVLQGRGSRRILVRRKDCSYLIAQKRNKWLVSWSARIWETRDRMKRSSDSW